jgi:hypothetical protein
MSDLELARAIREFQARPVSDWALRKPGVALKAPERLRHGRVKHALTLEERLLEASRKARDTARKLPPGKERAMLLRSARESEAAAQITNWISPPRLKPAK